MPLTSNPARAWFALFGVVCSLLAGVSGEVYPSHGQRARHHRQGANCRSERQVLGDTDHSHEIELATRRMAAKDVSDPEDLSPGLTAFPAGRSGFVFHRSTAWDLAARTPARRSFDIDVATLARPPPVSL